MIRDLAEIESVFWENKIKLAVIQEIYLGCDARFALSVVRDLLFPLSKFHEINFLQFSLNQ